MNYVPYKRVAKSFMQYCLKTGCLPGSNTYFRKHKSSPSTIQSKVVIETIVRNIDANMGDETLHQQVQTLMEAIYKEIIERSILRKDTTPAYFPSDRRLVDVLNKAKMNLDVDTLKQFPQEVMVMWPEGSTWRVGKKDLPLYPCIMRFGGAASDMMRDGFTSLGMDPDAPPDDSLKSLITQRCCHDIGYSYLMAHGTEEEALGLVRGGDDKYAIMNVEASSLQSALCGEISLDTAFIDQETTPFLYHMEAVVKLLVYTLACPSAVNKDWPTKHMRKHMSNGTIPFELTFPDGKRSVGTGDGTSPDMHWRDWHFRRYPMKRDGTRKDGIVFVSGSMVNGKHLDPRTVEALVNKPKGDRVVRRL